MEYKKMNEELIHLIKTAFIDLNRSRIRTFLTALGILIGVMSVVMNIALGLGLKNYIEKQFESLGANLRMIMPGSGFGGQGGFGPGLVTGARFDEKDVNSLKRIPNVRYTVPLYFKSTKVDTGGEAKFGYLMGVNEDYFSLMNTQLLEGEIFSKSELQSRAKIAVLGEKIADELFDTPQDAVGKNIRFDEQRFKIIGVIKKSGDNEQDNSIIIPYKTTFGSINPDKTFWAIYLVVGGIGIMNIMYASVTERTKEIGIRRAVGATEKDILLQFLTESVILSVFGGIMGLILSIILVLGIRIFFPATINLLSVIITLVISTGIGIFFGVFPARRAAKLPPIEAIRYE